jgi:hypothetical protein
MLKATPDSSQRFCDGARVHRGFRSRKLFDDSARRIRLKMEINSNLTIDVSCLSYPG